MNFNLTINKINGIETSLVFNDINSTEFDNIKDNIINNSSLDLEDKDNYREESFAIVLGDLVESFSLEVYDEESCILSESDFEPSYIEDVINLLEDFTSAKEIFYQLNDIDGLYCAEWLPFDDDFFLTYFSSPIDVAHAVYFGDIKNWSDNYIRFNGYGNLESTYQIDYDDEFESIVKRYISENI